MMPNPIRKMIRGEASVVLFKYVFKFSFIDKGYWQLTTFIFY